MKINNWEYYLLKGTDISSIKGHHVTISDNKTCPQYWFSGTSTIILGRTSNPEQVIQNETLCTWDFKIKNRDLLYIESCYLIIGCIRFFGGLHSKKYDSRVDVFLNKHQIDGFGLRIVPENHSDYFHRIPEYKIQKTQAIKHCKTLYTWVVNQDFLNVESNQSIELRIDKEVYWDIDYIGFALKLKAKVPRIFLSHSWKDKEIARLLSKQLAKEGIHCWIDEAEINIGDSLIEKIREAIDNVEYVGALISKSSVKSEWVKKELDVAMNKEINGKRIKVLPILLDDTELPGFLLGKLYADLRSIDNLGEVARMILNRIE